MNNRDDKCFLQRLNPSKTTHNKQRHEPITKQWPTESIAADKRLGEKCIGH